MNKWGHDASACLLTRSPGRPLGIEIFLKERLTRKKKAKGPLEPALLPIRGKTDPARSAYAENSYLGRPDAIEARLAARHPSYFDQVRELGLEPFYSRFNRDIGFVSHHRCHALAVAAISPYRKSLVLVIDGAGNSVDDFDDDDGELVEFPRPANARARVGKFMPSEWCSVYLQDGPRVTCVAKEWQYESLDERGRPLPPTISLGNLFAEASRHIFNSPMDA
ncbi:MAG: hypothetical protein HY075_07880 [Deltaproteobacteria bacterium]|nr:hypothetical protein [Deltaproteobacteria bacterium]